MNKFHILVDGKPCCSSRALMSDPSLTLGAGGCGSFNPERVKETAAVVQAKYPDLKVVVEPGGCHEGCF